MIRVLEVTVEDPRRGEATTLYLDLLVPESREYQIWAAVGNDEAKCIHESLKGSHEALRIFSIQTELAMFSKLQKDII